MKTLRVLSAMLDYPTADLQAAAVELKAAVAAEGLLKGRDRAALDLLIDDIAGGDIYDLQERWLLLFDRMKTLSLHLFEHVHGDSRDRGQAMVDLRSVYGKGGFLPVTQELPDYIPMFLEYASTRPPQEAIALVGEPAHIFAALRERLAKRKSPYEAAMAALVALSRARLDAETVAALLAEPDHDPDDLEALDAAWEDEEVTFGPAATEACGRDSLAARLRQNARPAPGVDVGRAAGAGGGAGTEVTHSGHALRRGG
jgi:nitrate reductase delta subunit